jgi:hypothetical protein
MPIGTKGWFYVFLFFDFEFHVAVQEWADEESAYLRQFFFLS